MLPNGAKGVGGPRVGRWGGRLARNRSPTARAHRANRPRPTPLPHPWPRCPPSQPHGPETWTERLTACHIPGGLHAHERNHPNPISQKPTNCATDPKIAVVKSTASVGRKITLSMLLPATGLALGVVKANIPGTEAIPAFNTELDSAWPKVMGLTTGALMILGGAR